MIPTAVSPSPPPVVRDPASLRAQAEALEATFLAEMLGHAGLAGGFGSFSGGPGEAQFASLLRHAQAEQVVRAGGIGLAEMIVRAIMARSDARA